MKDDKIEVEIVYKEMAGEFVGWIKGYPNIISQGHTLPELKEGLKDALNCMLEYLLNEND